MSELAFPGGLSRGDPSLSERHREVLAAVVGIHGRMARPVGSETLAHEGGIPLSSASIRNALAELEEMGLLERHHSSAGRTPSIRGYEYFIRALVRPAELPDHVQAEIDRILLRSAHDVEQLLNEASRLLSSITHQLGLAVASTLELERLVRLDLESLGERRALMVLGLEAGAAQTLVLELDSPLDREELEEVAVVLRERVVGLSLQEVRDRLAGDPELVRWSAARLVARAAAESWSRAVATPLFSAGAAHMAQQPEFASSRRLGAILAAVESVTPLDRLMVLGIEGLAGVRVGLGEGPGLAACSLVSYRLPGRVPAAVGVLGPLRMNYAYALAVVDTVGARVAELIHS
jgi:heat-inducible transcriptional repressor